MSENIRIWWIDEPETRAVSRVIESGRGKFPKYLKEEIHNRYGRAGRGRVWVAPCISFDGTKWDDTLPVCQKIWELSSGGIAYKAEDHHPLMDYIGIVTDCEMEVSE